MLVAIAGIARAENTAPLAVGAIKPAVIGVVGPRQVETGAVRLCRLAIHSRDRSPTNLRATSDIKGQVVATLPASVREHGQWIGPRIQVIASRGGWFLIADSRWTDREGPEERLFSGRGWMAANLAGFTIEAFHLLAEPRADAARLLSLSSPPDVSPAWGSDSVTIERIHGCSGSFADVSVKRPDGRRARGWAGPLCGNQLTTCGGGLVVYEEREGDLYLPAAACREDAERCPTPR